MNKGQAIVVMVILGSLMAACVFGDSTPEPTQIEIPPTLTETAGPDDLQQDGQEETLPPPETAEPSPTPQATPTTAPVAVATATLDKGLPDQTAVPADTSTPVPQPGSTAEEPADGGALISSFRANVDIANPGDQITLSWSTTGAITVTLWKLAPTGQLSDFWDVEPVGSYDYQIGVQEHNFTKFALFAAGASGDSQMASLTVILRCQAEWFFEGAPDICPASSPLESAAAEQRFEGGTMIWVAQEDLIYVLFNDSTPISWNAYPDEWDPGEPDRDPDLFPPSSLFQPVRGFGLVWREQSGVRERLGWAVSEEQSYNTEVQRTSYAKYNETYIRALDGAIWLLEPERSGWEKIPG